MKKLPLYILLSWTLAVYGQTENNTNKERLAKNNPGIDKQSNNSIFFLNKTTRPIHVQKRTVLEVGSFPYVLTESENIFQSIPIETINSLMLHVCLVPARGPYGTAFGNYYLFNPNDTIVLETKDNELVLTHITSAQRTKELSFDIELQKEISITPYYTLDRTNYKFFKLIEVSGISLKERDRLIDSITRPYIDKSEQFSVEYGVSQKIGYLYKKHYEGMLYYYKLGESSNYKNNPKVGTFYNDSLSTWIRQMNCDVCENIPFFRLAIRRIFGSGYGNLSPINFLKSVQRNSSGDNKNYLLTRYVLDKSVEINQNKQVMELYDSLCTNEHYKQILKDNSELSAKINNTTDIAWIMNGDKKKTGFNEFILRNRGKTIYVDFWASWCKPCIEEFPYSRALNEKVKDMDILMLYISTDTDFGSWKEANKRHKLEGQNSFILLNSGKDGLSKKLDISSVPRYLIIDKNGKISSMNATRPSEEETYNALIKVAKMTSK